MAKEMTWNEFVSEYKPIEFDDDARTDLNLFTKPATHWHLTADQKKRLGEYPTMIEPISRYLTAAEAVSNLPFNHVAAIYLNDKYFDYGQSNGGFNPWPTAIDYIAGNIIRNKYKLGYFVTKKPAMNKGDQVAIDCDNNFEIIISYELGSF